jgi:hypothetical protein
MMRKYLLYIAQNYSFEILRPIQAEIRNRGDECAWYVSSDEVDISRFFEDELVISSPEIASKYDSIAVFTPGNIVPDFLSGLKVQIFHGLEWKKKGHFKIRGFFDLYCTQGPITTERFNELADKHQYFHVRETGWSKLDPLFSVKPFVLNTNKKVVLYAPTFSKKLTSAIDLFDEIKRIASIGEYYWLVKFHPLMNPELIAMYKELEGEEFKVINDHSVLPLLARADVMLSDTSSVIGEFSLLGKPVVTLRNSAPDEALFNMLDPSELESSLNQALSISEIKQAAIRKSNLMLHPSVDGRSSARILDACNEIIDSGLILKKRKPYNLYRNYKIRKNLGYWKLF